MALKGNEDYTSGKELPDTDLPDIDLQTLKNGSFVKEKSESSSESEFLDVIEHAEPIHIHLINNATAQHQEIENVSISTFNTDNFNTGNKEADTKKDPNFINKTFETSQLEVDITNKTSKDELIPINDILEKSPKFILQAQTPLLYKSRSVGAINITAEVESPQPSVGKPIRAGKYKKRAAPLPPTNKQKEVKAVEEFKNSDNENASTIKATLVLKPGTVKPIGSSEDSSISEVFISPSPKLKRKSKSPSKQQESPLARFMMISKKLNFWHKDEDNAHHIHPDVSDVKRSSWYAELPKSSHFLLVNSKPLSKSAENFHIKKLKHSPKFRNKVFDVLQNLGLDSDSD